MLKICDKIDFRNKRFLLAHGFRELARQSFDLKHLSRALWWQENIPEESVPIMVDRKWRKQAKKWLGITFSQEPIPETYFLQLNLDSFLPKWPETSQATSSPEDQTSKIWGHFIFKLFPWNVNCLFSQHIQVYISRDRTLRDTKGILYYEESTWPPRWVELQVSIQFNIWVPINSPLLHGVLGIVPEKKSYRIYNWPFQTSRI